MENLDRDSIDFGKTNIPRLFASLFFPTLLELVFGALLNVADGIFVGKGVGSDALAAINIAAPIFLIGTAVALMFGSGVSVVAAVHLSRGNLKAANINVTQAVTVPAVVMLAVSLVIFFFASPISYLFGGSSALEPMVVEYLHYVSPVPVLYVFFMVGAFVIRLDGSPKYAMYCNVIPALLNIVLDWLMVFPLGWGLMGAATATTVSMAFGSCMTMDYLFRHPHQLRFYRPKFTRTSLWLTGRNVCYMMKLGFATFVGESAITVMIIVGNYMFISRLHEAGVAAFSVCCYLFPLVFMFGNAVAQSQLPIISYNKGLGDYARVRSTFRISLVVTTLCALVMTLGGIFNCSPLLSLFLDKGTDAYRIAVGGFPYFSLSFVFFSLNIVIIGFYQGMERARLSGTFMLLCGLVILVPVFILLPVLLGDTGLWLSVPLSEALTFLTIVTVTLRKWKKLFLVTD